jgi:hypothetical protein
MADIIQYVKVKDLCLDPHNPRLPENLQGSNQTEVLAYLFENGALEELAQSYLDNGFFDHEPLIVLRQGKKEERRTVLEGNRRLAALMILHGFEEAGDLSFAGIQAPKGKVKQLSDVPCYEISNREEVHNFLGFRHIGGLKAWAPEAKARYLVNEVARSVKSGEKDPFRVVGRRVGSNAQGVRNSYIALRILQHGRDEFGIDSTYVQQKRFGVWLRCMNSTDIREYIGFGGATTYKEVIESLNSIKENKLREVLEDLAPKEGYKKALLADSRDVTDYGRIISDKYARAALRKYNDITLARSVIDEINLPQRVSRLAESCKLIVEELHNAEVTKELVDAAEQLFAVSRSIHDIVEGRSKSK